MNKPLLLRRLAPLVMLLALADGARGTEAADQVGEATLVIGMVSVVSSDGVARPVQRGSAIRVGDRLETGAGGHVHLHFVDGGRLSVRPSSRLQIENYSRSGEQPALTAIKLRLDEGVVRSITGAWGEAARERFRLNTPLAAIGVKGTDFVVKADANLTQASVYTGAIMLTPLASGCQTSFGPCQNGHEKLLSESMKGQMLTLSRLQSIPQLVPAVDLLAQRARPALGEASIKLDDTTKTQATRPDMGNEKTVVSESRAVGTLVSQSASAAQHIQQAQQAEQVRLAEQSRLAQQAEQTRLAQEAALAEQARLTQEALRLEQARLAQEVALAEQATRLAQEAAQAEQARLAQEAALFAQQRPLPQVTQLVWSRLASVAADGDTLSRSYTEAAQNGRQGTVGNGAYSLFRQVAAGTPAVLVSADTAASFRLAGATAQVVYSDRGRDVIEPVRVDNGTLSVNFANATYATQLNLSSARIGSDSISSSGDVRSNGLLFSSAGNARTVGALSLDGKEAGYFFEKSVASGFVSGISLWGR